MQKTFEPNRRFITWLRNNKKWNKRPNKEQKNSYESVF